MRKERKQFLIRQIMILSSQLNCGYHRDDFRFKTLKKLQKTYREMSEQTSNWLEVFGGVFNEKQK